MCAALSGLGNQSPPPTRGGATLCPGLICPGPFRAHHRSDGKDSFAIHVGSRCRGRFRPASGDELLGMEATHEFFRDSWDCDSGTIWSKPTTMTTGRFLPRGSFFFEARTTVQKTNGLHIGKDQRRRFAIADGCERRPRSQEQDCLANEAFSGTRVVSTNVTVHRAAPNDVEFKTRATRGSVCNGLLRARFGARRMSIPA